MEVGLGCDLRRALTCTFNRPRASRVFLAGLVLCLASSLVPISAADAGSSKRCLGRAATIQAGAGAQRIAGTPGADVIVAGSGNDKVFGRGGDDRICGGRGNDVLRGQGGTDRIAGGPGSKDVCYGDRFRASCETAVLDL